MIRSTCITISTTYIDTDITSLAWFIKNNGLTICCFSIQSIFTLTNLMYFTCCITIEDDISLILRELLIFTQHDHCRTILSAVTEVTSQDNFIQIIGLTKINLDITRMVLTIWCITQLEIVVCILITIIQLILWCIIVISRSGI